MRLFPGHNYEQALRGLERFERIWLIFGFDRNTGGSRNIVRPPGSEERVGVFATRSPYRPNALGLSAVRLERVQGLDVLVSEIDLLDGTPVYDIKPYVPTYDSFPESGVAGYARPESREVFGVRFTAASLQQIAVLLDVGGPDLKRVALLQLSYEPLDDRRKRVRPAEPQARDAHTHVLAFRMWRIRFHLNRDKRSVTVSDVCSGYTPADLLLPEDPYQDKAEHRSFVHSFPTAREPEGPLP